MNRLKPPLFVPAPASTWVRRALAASAGLAFLTLSGGPVSAGAGRVGQRGVGPGSPREAEAPSTSLLGTSPHGGSGDPRSIRRLGEDFRVETTRRLLAFSESEALLNIPLRKLELVRALSQHEGQLHKIPQVRIRVVRALIRLFKADHSGVTDPEKEDPQAAGLRHWARGSAALALVKSAHQEGVRALAAVAIDGPQSDPVGAKLAQAALRTVPVERLRQFQLAPLIDEQELVAAVHPTVDNGDSPEDASTLVALGPRLISKESPEARASSVTFASALAQLSQTERLPAPFDRVESWEKAYRKSPTWTLRALGCLAPLLPKKLHTWATMRARDSKKRKAEPEQSAAVWALAILEPVAPAIPRDDLHDPRVWSRLSTSKLRAMEAKDNDPKIIAILASRLRTEPRGRGPDVTTLHRWLNHESALVRSAAARGLAHATDEVASGLLLSAYRAETNPQVRRAIISALRTRGLTADPAVQTLLSLDPDPGCQSRARGTRDPEAQGFFIGVSTRKQVTLVDREGRLLETTPALDGFVGLVRDTL